MCFIHSLSGSIHIVSLQLRYEFRNCDVVGVLKLNFQIGWIPTWHKMIGVLKAFISSVFLFHRTIPVILCMC